MSTANAVAAANNDVEQLHAKERLLRNIAPASTWIDTEITATLANALPDINPTLVRALTASGGRPLLDEVRFASQDAAVRRLWQQHRIVYDIDPDLWAELADTDLNTVIPDTLFRHLPHPDPYVAFPKPLTVAVNDHEQQTISGFFVRGGADETHGVRQCSTHAPGATHLGVVLVGMLQDGDGRPSMAGPGVQDAIITRLTLDPRVGTGTVSDMLEASSRRFIGAAQAGDWRTQLPVMIRAACSLLVYLCTTNADLRPVPRQATRSTSTRSAAKPRKPARVITVGYRVGAALRAHRQAAQHPNEAATGRTVTPHVRRSHFHTYKIGPGRTQEIVKWLGPIEVNTSGPAATTTAVPVRARH